VHCAQGAVQFLHGPKLTGQRLISKIPDCNTNVTRCNDVSEKQRLAKLLSFPLVKDCGEIIPQALLVLPGWPSMELCLSFLTCKLGPTGSVSQGTHEGRGGRECTHHLAERRC
jgi:hypothetical protein